MKNEIRKKVLLIICLIVLFIPTWFFYKLATLPTYREDGITLTYKNNVYVDKSSNLTEKDSIGKVIGIVINKNRKRKFSDLIFGTRVKEFENDKDHKRIYVRWLMGPEVVYERVWK